VSANGRQDEKRLDLAGRLALSIPEAAMALGVSERLVRDLLPELPHVRLGRRTVIPVGPLEEWLRERAKVEQGRAEKVAEEILRGLGE
jgi:hypothetical protein